MIWSTGVVPKAQKYTQQKLPVYKFKEAHGKKLNWKKNQLKKQMKNLFGILISRIQNQEVESKNVPQAVQDAGRNLQKRNSTISC